jgi:hypothetical protein
MFFLGRTLIRWPPRPTASKMGGRAVLIHQLYPYPTPGRTVTLALLESRTQLSGNNLHVAPLPLTEVKEAESRHVARVQMKVAPSVRPPLRVGGPDNVLDTDRFQ